MINYFQIYYFVTKSFKKILRYLRKACLFIKDISEAIIVLFLAFVIVGLLTFILEGGFTI